MLTLRQVLFQMLVCVLVGVLLAAGVIGVTPTSAPGILRLVLVLLVPTLLARWLFWRAL